MKFSAIILFIFLFAFKSQSLGINPINKERSLDENVEILEGFLSQLERENFHDRFKRDSTDQGVTNMDIRDAILQLLNVIRDSKTKLIQHDKNEGEVSNQILAKLGTISSTDSIEKKIDNISTFLLRMNAKIDALSRRSGRGGGDDALATLAQESFDILTLLPTYIENTKDAVTNFASETKSKFDHIENLLVLQNTDDNMTTLAEVVKSVESNILNVTNQMKDVMMESADMSESLIERVSDGYKELVSEIKGVSNVEKVLLETADSVSDVKRKVEFGVQQISYKLEDVMKSKGGKLDDTFKEQLTEIANTILFNQTEALKNLSDRVEKEIGQVWRQMGIMYAQVSSSITILEKVKSYTEGYVNKTGNNLGSMSGQVEGLADRMVDVDQNLNYMLGQLSLVVQEFNQVKTGLNEALTSVEPEIKEFQPTETPQISDE